MKKLRLKHLMPNVFTYLYFKMLQQITFNQLLHDKHCLKHKTHQEDKQNEQATQKEVRHTCTYFFITNSTYVCILIYFEMDQKRLLSISSMEIRLVLA